MDITYHGSMYFFVFINKLWLQLNNLRDATCRLLRLRIGRFSDASRRRSVGFPHGDNNEGQMLLVGLSWYLFLPFFLFAYFALDL